MKGIAYCCLDTCSSRSFAETSYNLKVIGNGQLDSSSELDFCFRCMGVYVLFPTTTFGFISPHTFMCMYK